MLEKNSNNSFDPKIAADCVKQTLLEEAAAISDLAIRAKQGSIDSVEVLFNCAGRVIVTGMGKMGAIARKCAATLCSTGTPAIFLHPTEALHGDLGIVTEDDVILVLSYSGETDEVVALIPFMQRHNVPIIALTGNSQSQLARHAKVVFDISVKREADPIAVAPTCSTTVALAACDAIAVALMTLHGFTREQFAIYHPGGSLGRKLLLTVDELMATGEELPIVDVKSTLRQSIVVISAKKLGAVFVINSAKELVGILTDGDLRRALESNDNPLACTIESLMTHNPTTILQSALAAEAMKLMEDKSISVLPVVNEENHPIGALHLHSLVQAGLA